ncbi:TetR/AcrR family transcriptional regulator [Thalassobaculum fulvum]|jgi:TetR/AcrR family transcriptional regulator|nr:TetR/AcrR family transcriptional regulator [Thalassobaculum fulvum]
MTDIASSDAGAKPASSSRRRGRVGERNRRRILTAAEKVFARTGYQGATLDEIARESMLPKANLLYYFKSKEALYHAVITDILEAWLAALGEISVDDDPAEALTGYIERKMTLSRERPDGSRVFAMEIITGAPVIGDYLRGTLRDWVERQGAVFRVWQSRGMMADLPPEHVFFAIWAMTQTYADFAPQVTAVLAVDQLEESDFRVAVGTVTALVLRGLGVLPQPVGRVGPRSKA